MKQYGVIVLKARDGRQAGYIRWDAEDGGAALTVHADALRGMKWAVLFNGEPARMVSLDASGVRLRLPRLPDALAAVDERGLLRALGMRAEGGLTPREAARAVQCLWQARGKARESGVTGDAQDAVQAAEARKETDEPAEARPREAEETEETEKAEETKEKAQGGTVIAAVAAWPPPPFFRAARFKDGAWRDETS